MPYEAQINQSHPMLYIFLLDQSGSMQDNNKAKYVASATNHVIHEIMRASQAGEHIKDTCSVGIIGYGGSVYSIVGGKISEVASKPLRIETVDKLLPDGAGGVISVKSNIPIWVEPRAENGTPMAEAFEHAFALIVKWIRNNPNSFPPIVINVTDGEPNDINRTRYAAKKIMNLETSDGKVLLFNAHITGLQTASEIILPGRNTEISDPYARVLFEISSTIPHRLLQKAHTIGFSSQSKSRGLVFNASFETLIQFLEIGTYPREFAYATIQSDSISQKESELHKYPTQKNWGTPIISNPSLPSIGSRPSRPDSADILKEQAPSIYPKKYRISISYPKRFSKRYSSLFLIQIYFPEMRAKVHQAIRSEFEKQKTTEHIKKSEFAKGQVIRLKLSAPGIDFTDPVNIKLDNNVNTANFTARPNDNCEPGIHEAVLSISDPNTQIEYQSIHFSIQVTDFAFDHLSRPFLSKTVSAILGTGSLIMFSLTFLGQIDSTFGLASGTVAGTLASAIYVQFFSFYKYARTTNP
jgi:uncharacterized protein YegL